METAHIGSVFASHLRLTIQNSLAKVRDERAWLEIGGGAHILSLRDQIAIVNLGRNFDEIIPLAETLEKFRPRHVNFLFWALDLADEFFPCNSAQTPASSILAPFQLHFFPYPPNSECFSSDSFLPPVRSRDREYKAQKRREWLASIKPLKISDLAFAPVHECEGPIFENRELSAMEFLG